MSLRIELRASKARSLKVTCCYGMMMKSNWMAMIVTTFSNKICSRRPATHHHAQETRRNAMPGKLKAKLTSELLPAIAATNRRVFASCPTGPISALRSGLLAIKMPYEERKDKSPHQQKLHSICSFWHQRFIERKTLSTHQCIYQGCHEWCVRK